MREPKRFERAPRLAPIETCEQRLMMSAQPVDLSLQTAELVDKNLQQTLAEAHNQTGLTQARSAYGFSGRGQTAVVIDTGIGYDHQALGGGFGAGYRVVGGWDFTEENDANPYDDGPYGSHGTHVAGIIGSSDGTRPGVAPGVDLVGLRVFNDAGQSQFAWIERALQWVHANRNSFNNPITTVNISIGVGWNSTNVPNWSTLEDDFAQLHRDGIFVSVAAGNSFAQSRTTGLSYPAASSSVVPVMSVDDNGSLSWFSQRHSRAIAAPGRTIASTVPDYRGNQNGRADDFVSYSGTSMASPYVAGASVLIRQAYAFVGNTSVNQDTIYNLMRNTADTVYDSATGQNYFRLNVGRAIDAIMPTDDFGSDVQSAHRLSTVVDTANVSGMIGRLNDRDCFTFTAGRTGIATFSSGVTGEMTTAWTLTGASASVNGNALTFNVVAGQSYTVGVGTSSGLGRYRLDVSIEGTTPTTDWGVVSQGRADNVTISGTGQQFALSAGRSGLLTVEAFFANADGNVDFELYNSAGRLVGRSDSQSNSERIDVQASAGETFYLRAIGQNRDVDFRLTNLVSQVGRTVTVSGTVGADTFAFAAGATHGLSINGVAYQFAASDIDRVSFIGGGGADNATLTGTAGRDMAMIRAGSAQLSGTGYLAQVSGVATVVVNSGGGTDTALLYDSRGNDSLVARPGNVRLTGTGFDHTAAGFAQVRVYASAGVDRATLYDSAGNDTLTGRPTETRLAGSGFDIVASLFDVVQVYASAGYDQAVLYDSAGNDIYTARPDSARMTGTGFDVFAAGFDRVRAYASQGLDQAYFYDSSGSDTFEGYSNRARLHGALFDNWAYGFDRVWAYSLAGGDDKTSLAALDYVFERMGQWR